MLADDLKTQLAAYLERVVRPIHIVASLDDGEKSQELRALLEDLRMLCDKITVDTEGTDARRPSFALTSPGHDISLRFAGLPMGHEFTSLVLALLQVGGHPSKTAQETLEQVAALDGDYTFETYYSLSCQNCPDVVQALNLAAVLNPRIRHTAIDGALFQDEVEAREILSVPTVFLNGQKFDQGRMTLEQIVAKLDTGAADRAAKAIAAKAPFDVLVVGGGPAGAAAAIYAARKPVYDRLLATQPHGLISGSGMDVGLPDGQMGNSEVGHMNLGAGRVVYQDFTRVTKAIRDGEFFANPTICAAVDKAVGAGKAVHILGLLSDGGVHSHQDHLVARAELAAQRGLVLVAAAGNDGPAGAPATIAPRSRLMSRLSRSDSGTSASTMRCASRSCAAGSSTASRARAWPACRCSSASAGTDTISPQREAQSPRPGSPPAA